jgi:hypothetical protein
MEGARCFAPGCLAFADHVDGFVTGNRASGAPKGAKPLTGTAAAFNGPMILFKNIIEVLHGTVVTLHTSDQYCVFGTRVISCSPREALYVLDGLLENDTILRPREHYTDTHGFTEQLFGLCFLLGYSFMPRLRDLADQQLYKVDRTLPLDTLGALVHTGIDLDLIPEQWDQLVRVAASLRNRVVPAHLANPPRGNNENPLTICPCRTGNQLCFADLCSTNKHARSTIT